jgi:hypothetical protein
MSVDTDDSFLTKLQNKVTYKLNEAVDDPNAKKYAEESKAKETQMIAAKAVSSQDQSTDKPPSTGRRILTKIWTGFTSGISLLWYPVACLVLAMFVANDMIVYAAPVRVLFFVFTFLVCYYLSYMFAALLFGYAIKGGYQWYTYRMVGDTTKDVMPTVFTILPITTYQPTSAIGSFVLAPFWYPQSEKRATALPDIMRHYWNQLQESFPGLSEVKNLPLFTTGLQKAQATLGHLHDPPKSVDDANA